jgi:hypothetical protein
MARILAQEFPIRPEDVVVFVELDGFAEDWHDLGLADDDLQDLQRMIMANPRGAPVVSGAGRLREIRYAPSRSGKGKSGGVRVCFVFFEEYSVVLLVLAYPKNAKEDLSQNEKKVIKRLIAEVQAEFAKGHRK